MAEFVGVKEPSASCPWRIVTTTAGAAFPDSNEDLFEREEETDSRDRVRLRRWFV